MNVLHIVTWYSAYNSEVLKEGVFHYEQASCQKKYCNVAIYFPYDASISEKFHQEIERNVLVFRSNPGRNKFLKYYYHLRNFRKVKKQFNPDIIHAHVALGAGRLAVLFGKLYKIPVVVTEHNPLELMHFDQGNNRKNAGKVYKKSRFNICVSPFQEICLRENFPLLKFQTIYNGVSDPFLLLKEQPVINIEREEKTINCCIVAAFYDKEIKGYQFLLPAIKKVLNDNLSIKLHICGGGTYFDFYKDYAESLGIGSSCEFYGQCDKEKVYSIVSQCDFLISASLFESAGISVEEALLLGKPVLVTKSGGANSLVADDNSVIVEKGSADLLADGINTIVMKIKKGEFNSEEIRKYGLLNFEMDCVNKKIIDQYKKYL